MKRTNIKATLKSHIIFSGVIFSLGVSGDVLSAGDVVQPPGEIRIEVLANKYEAVLFDHALHDGYASCVECHHHVISAPPSDPVCLPCHSEGKELAAVGCRDCHPVNRYASHDIEQAGTARGYHDDTPGLIGAYHQNCIACHRVIGTGPTGCEECHKKKP